MKTLVATVSIGARAHLTQYSVPRMERWARAHGLEFAVVWKSLVDHSQPPHFNKLAIPAAYPGYDRYVIVDDDLLISRHAPSPPRVSVGCIGLVPDPEQRNTTATHVGWTGNTGFMIVDREAADLCAAALAHGSEPTVWGYADQGALNHVAWREKRVEKIDARWNFLPVVHYFMAIDAWEAWRTNRLFRLGYYARVLWPFSSERRALRAAWGVHLVRAPYAALFSALID